MQFVNKFLKLIECQLLQTIRGIIERIPQRVKLLANNEPYLLNSWHLPVKGASCSETASKWSSEFLWGRCHFSSCSVWILVTQNSLEILSLNSTWFIEVKKSKKSIKLGRLDFIIFNLKEVNQSPLKILLHDESVKVSIETFKCLINSDTLWDDPSLDLFNYWVFPVKTVCEVVFFDIGNWWGLYYIQECLVINEANLLFVHEREEFFFDRQTQCHYLV